MTQLTTIAVPTENIFTAKENLVSISNQMLLLLQIYFGTIVARIYLVADLLRINCHTGMSALMRKCLINEVGGIQAFSCYLAEDFFFAKSFSDRGWRIRVASLPALQNSGLCEITSFQARLQRYVNTVKCFQIKMLIYLLIIMHFINFVDIILSQ